MGNGTTPFRPGRSRRPNQNRNRTVVQVILRTALRFRRTATQAHEAGESIIVGGHIPAPRVGATAVVSLAPESTHGPRGGVGDRVLDCAVLRLGYPSFWDPDEAHYAETSREMLAAHNWLVPLYDGQPFFDKPVLFHWLQMVSFWLLGETELAARLVPALAGLGLLGCTAWVGRELFSFDAGELAALMLAVLPATFALSAYAILDMLFTTFLFGGAALLAVGALKDRPHLQYPAYGLIALAILTKGPVTLVLLGLAFAISLLFAPTARVKLLSLRWREGVLAILLCSLPWFIWMWIRFDGAFVQGYVLQENLWLFARSRYARQYSPLIYLRVLLVGVLRILPRRAAESRPGSRSGGRGGYRRGRRGSQ